MILDEMDEDDVNDEVVMVLYDELWLIVYGDGWWGWVLAGGWCSLAIY